MATKCIACNGSGHYDHNGAPPCGACAGTGEEQVECKHEGAILVSCDGIHHTRTCDNCKDDLSYTACPVADGDEICDDTNED